MVGRAGVGLNISSSIRKAELYKHIDMGFLNKRLCFRALPDDAKDFLSKNTQQETDHIKILQNDHLLVKTLLDVCSNNEVPTLRDVLRSGKEHHLFRSVEQFEACPDIYDSDRVEQKVRLQFETTKPVMLEYHTKHICSDTGRMTLATGYTGQYWESMVGLLHSEADRFRIEPIVMGAPIIDHPRNQGLGQDLAWNGLDYGELKASDIDQFASLNDVNITSSEEWMNYMGSTPEEKIKEAFCELLNEPKKKDWGGEMNDHFSSQISISGKEHSAAFLLKGPAKFSEMVPAMCGKNGDQIYRLHNSGAEISILQHCHLIGEAVRAELRAFTVQPGNSHRRYCIIDGQTTYKILKANDLL